MRVDELRDKRVAIWGYGREGRAALQFLREWVPATAVTILDDSADVVADAPLILGRTAIEAASGDFDVVVKSPGISLYDPLVEHARASGARLTSLLNLWFANTPTRHTICVTGTKGKSTTAALIAHILSGLGHTVGLAGNIGVPVTSLPRQDLDFAVIEISSYQAADFDGCCDIAVLTSLFQEHLDWHGTLDTYHRDKLNLLRHARQALINAEAEPVVARLLDRDYATFNPHATWPVRNRYLARLHNMANLSAAIGVAQQLAIDVAAVLRVAESFKALPHRQQELGEINGVLYVDDSISTTPESAMAALDAYRGRPVTIILGGQDRGIGYVSLADRLCAEPLNATLLLGESGSRIHSLLGQRGCRAPAEFVSSMADALACARAMTPRGGVVLLSPAAPSYDVYRSFVERGEDFAREAGFDSNDPAGVKSQLSG